MVNAIIIVGPTAVGKSALAQNIAKEIKGEIISADATQVYRLLNIGTAKILPSEQLVPHHLIDIRNPDEHYSCGEFVKDAKDLCKKITQKGRLPIIVGGTIFYIYALIQGIPEEKEIDDKIKAFVDDISCEYGLSFVYKWLKICDEEWAKKISENDTYRIKHGFSFYLSHNTKYSSYLKSIKKDEDFSFNIIGLSMKKENLNKKIEERVKKMLKCGLIDEVEHILYLGYSPSLPSLQCIGYKEAIMFLQGKLKEEELFLHICKATKNLAKRQMCWLRNKFHNITWFDAETIDLVHKVIKVISPS
jgi:tRNA dimethylallyltransferase